jgi:hypothetical protein
VIQPEDVFEIPGCDTLIVSCTATGAPLDSFIFTQDGVVLSAESPDVNISITEETAGGLMIATATLTLCSVTSVNAGEYTCEATLGSDTDNSSFIVNVIAGAGTNKVMWVHEWTLTIQYRSRASNRPIYNIWITKKLMVTLLCCFMSS